MADTIGDLLRFAKGGQLGVTQGMGPPPTPDVPGLPPELLALRPQVQQGPKWAQVIGRIGDTLALMAGGQAHYGNQIRDEQAAQDDWDQRVALESYRARQRLDELRAKAMQPPEPTAMERNFQWWSGLDPKQKESFAQYQDVVEPRFVPDGFGGGQYVSRGGSIPQGFNPDEWEIVPGPQGGPTPRASGGF